jgi:hypothetical protein
MAIINSINKQRAWLLAIVLLVCAGFSADVIDLREDLALIPASGTSLEGDDTQGIVAVTVFEKRPDLVSRLVDEIPSLPVFILHSQSHRLRAPPVFPL